MELTFVAVLVVFWKLKPHGGISFGVNFCWGFGCVLEVETPWWDVIWSQLLLGFWLSFESCDGKAGPDLQSTL